MNHPKSTYASGGAGWKRAIVASLSLFAVALVAAACGGSSDDSTSGSAETGSSEPQSLKSVSLHLDWLPIQQHAGYYVAKSKGFYEEEGLEVELEPGEGTTEVVQQVSTGHSDFGNAYGLGVVFGNAAGANVKAVANYGADAAVCVAVLAESGITEPSDFEGKTIGNGTGSPFASVIPIVWANSGTDASKVTMQEVNPAAGIPSLAQGRIDGFVGNSWEVPIEMEDKFGKEADCILYRDYGAELMGPSIIASDEKIEKEPEVVEAFVAASIKGWLYSFEHPEEAAEALVQEAGDVEGIPSEAAIVTAQPLLVDTIPSSNNVGEPYGSMTDEDWEKTEQIMEKYLELEDTPPASQLYTNEFIPQDSPTVQADGIPR